MLPIERTIDALGGIARTRDLHAAGFWQSMIQLFSNYGIIVNVRPGWWATRHTPPAVVLARRAGGRLACHSALAYHGDGADPAEVHVALERSGKRPTQPGIVVHWSRAALPGDRAAVSQQIARRQAAHCDLNAISLDIVQSKERTMSNPFTTAGFAGAVDQLRELYDLGQRGGTRMGRGDVRAAVLSLLAEKPMHGYQIIQEIGERSNGAWKPSAGSVYPTLQLLADEGLVSVEESNGRKTYSLTAEGRAVADTAGSTPWETPGGRESGRHGALPKAGLELAQATAQVGRSGSPEQVQQAVAVLDEARRKVYAILAQG